MARACIKLFLRNIIFLLYTMMEIIPIIEVHKKNSSYGNQQFGVISIIVILMYLL
jgi:hypothetical protein